MKLDLMFDMLVHDHNSHGEVFKLPVKGKNLELSPIEQRKVIHKAIQAYLYNPVSEQEDHSKTVRKIQAFSGSSDIAQLTKDVFNVTNEMTPYDVFWQKAFRTVPLRKGQGSWEIATAGSYITYKLIPEGGKVEFASLWADKVMAEVQKYGSGIAVTWETIEFRKLYQFIELMEQQRNALYEIWANVHYGLLGEASALTPYDYQGESGQTTLDRDIQTINYACYMLSQTNKDKGYGDTANARYVIYASPKYKARLNAAQRATGTDVVRGGNSGVTIDYPIDVYYTNDSRLTADCLTVVLPKNKLQNAVYMEHKSFKEQDMKTLSILQSDWTCFGAYIADTEQVCEISMIAPVTT